MKKAAYSIFFILQSLIMNNIHAKDCNVASDSIAHQYSKSPFAMIVKVTRHVSDNVYELKMLRAYESDRYSTPRGISSGTDGFNYYPLSELVVNDKLNIESEIYKQALIRKIGYLLVPHAMRHPAGGAVLPMPAVGEHGVYLFSVTDKSSEIEKTWQKDAPAYKTSISQLCAQGYFQFDTFVAGLYPINKYKKAVIAADVMKNAPVYTLGNPSPQGFVHAMSERNGIQMRGEYGSGGLVLRTPNWRKYAEAKGLLYGPDQVQKKLAPGQTDTRRLFFPPEFSLDLLWQPPVFGLHTREMQQNEPIKFYAIDQSHFVKETDNSSSFSYKISNLPEGFYRFSFNDTPTNRRNLYLMDSKINTDFKYNNFAEFIKNQDRYYEYFNLKKQVYQDESALLKDQDIIGSKNYWFTSFQKDNPLAFEYNVYVKPRGETIIILQ